MEVQSKMKNKAIIAVIMGTTFTLSPLVSYADSDGINENMQEVKYEEDVQVEVVNVENMPLLTNLKEDRIVKLEDSSLNSSASPQYSNTEPAGVQFAFGKRTNNGYCIKAKTLGRGSHGVLSFGWKVGTYTGETYYLADSLKIKGSKGPYPKCSIELHADSSNAIVGWRVL